MDLENMDHLAVAFEDNGSGTHYTQADKKSISCRLIFIVGQDKSKEPMRMVSIRIPRGLPVGRLRTFVTAMEAELTSIMGHRAKRAPIVFIKEDYEADWNYDYNLPLYNVVFN